jgi:hypothetical protein
MDWLNARMGQSFEKNSVIGTFPSSSAPQINKFYLEHLIPYLNFYRPCHYPEKEELANGKVKIRYPKKGCMTPYQKLLSLPHWEAYLQSYVTKEMLEQKYKKKTPLQAAKEKKKARDELMKIALPKLTITIPSSTANE